MEKPKQIANNLLKIKDLINENLQLIKSLYSEDKSLTEYNKLKKARINYERLLGLVSQIKKIQ
jgi:hypothetical protein